MHPRTLLTTTALAAAALLAIQRADAQFQVNPQLGLTLTDLTKDQAGVETRAAVGYLFGADFRIGDRFYFQPGFYYGRSATGVKNTFSANTVIEDDLVRTTAKLKALVGLNLIHKTGFKLRLNAGPTYDALLSVDNKGDKIAFNRDDFKGGSFNMDGGIGLDLWILTAETGLSYGLSKAFKDREQLSRDAKYFTWYLNVGVVLGSSGN